MIPEIMTRLLIINIPCSKRFHLGTIIFQPNYAHQLYHFAGGNMHPYYGGMLVFIKAWESKHELAPLLSLNVSSLC